MADTETDIVQITITAAERASAEALRRSIALGPDECALPQELRPRRAASKSRCLLPRSAERLRERLQVVEKGLREFEAELEVLADLVSRAGREMNLGEHRFTEREKAALSLAVLYADANLLLLKLRSATGSLDTARN